MARSTIMTAIVTSLAVALASGPVLADPGNGKGQGQGQGHGKGQAPHAQGQGQGQGNSGGHKQSAGGNDWHGGPSIDRGDVLGILGGHRNYWSPGPALPPGIQKNLARGKPLPPGIAKNFDSRLISRLPYYEGYEWKQIGRDVVLVAIATGIVYEILRNVLD